VLKAQLSQRLEKILQAEDDDFFDDPDSSSPHTSPPTPPRSQAGSPNSLPSTPTLGTIIPYPVVAERRRANTSSKVEEQLEEMDALIFGEDIDDNTLGLVVSQVIELHVAKTGGGADLGLSVMAVYPHRRAVLLL
jgi:hypothetical protein